MRFYRRRFDKTDLEEIEITEKDARGQLAPHADDETWEEVKERMKDTITPVLGTVGAIYWVKEG